MKAYKICSFHESHEGLYGSSNQVKLIVRMRVMKLKMYFVGVFVCMFFPYGIGLAISLRHLVSFQLWPFEYVFVDTCFAFVSVFLRYTPPPLPPTQYTHMPIATHSSHIHHPNVRKPPTSSTLHYIMHFIYFSIVYISSSERLGPNFLFKVDSVSSVHPPSVWRPGI